MEQHLRMREAAEQHGRPTVPVSGLYFRMEDHDHTKRFKNHMRLKILGTVAWLEFPTGKRRRQFVLPLSPDGEDAIRIDWSPAYPEWKSGRLQLVVEEGERGIKKKRKCSGSSTQSIRRKRWRSISRPRGVILGLAPLSRCSWMVS